MSMDISIFLSYADKDKEFMEKMIMYLKSSGVNNIWSNQELHGGDDQERKNTDALERADIILLLISPDFLIFDRCKKEMERALERRDAGKVRAIPILLRPTFFLEGHPLLKLQMLPSNDKPVTDWENVDGAYKYITENIHLVIKEILAIKKAIKEKYAQYICDAERFFMEGKHQEVLEMYKKAIRLANNYSYLGDHLPSLYKKEGDSLRLLIAKSGNDPNQSALVARFILKVQEQDKTIVAVLGWTKTAQSTVVLPILSQAHIPVVSATATGDGLPALAPSYFFRVIPPNKMQSTLLVNYVKSHFANSRLAAFYDRSDPFSKNFVEDDFQQEYNAAGYSFVGEVGDYLHAKAEDNLLQSGKEYVLHPCLIVIWRVFMLLLRAAQPLLPTLDPAHVQPRRCRQR